MFDALLAHRRIARKSIVTLALAGFVVAGATSALAEATEVRLSHQHGLNFFPVQVVVEQKLIEKNAKKLGLADTRVSVHQFGSGAVANDAILSGRIDFNATGIGPMITMWEKTAGRLNVRAALPIAATPTTLITIDPRVKSLRDYTTIADHQIALPAIKVSMQARILQVAAAKELGLDRASALDQMTVSMQNPDAFVAIKTGGSTVKSHFAVEPYTSMGLNQPGARTVVSSYDVLGGKHTLTVLWTTEKFKVDNPKLYQAVVGAFQEAMTWMNENPKETAELFIRLTKSPLARDEVAGIIADKNKMDYNSTPMRTLEFAHSMHRIGALAKKPDKWTDLFWENTHHLPGS